ARPFAPAVVACRIVMLLQERLSISVAKGVMMTRKTTLRSLLKNSLSARRPILAAVLAPALTLGSFSLAADRPDPVQDFGNAIIRVAAQAEQPAVVDPPPLVAPPEASQGPG